MHTRTTTDIQIAASAIRDGRLVAFPTETVYGLGARVGDSEAIKNIFIAKGRPPDNPLIVHVAEPSWIAGVTSSVSAMAADLVDAFFPAPLTLVLPKHPDISDNVSAGLKTIGVRMPDHELALAFLKACGEPVAAPSANQSGRPSPTTWEAVVDDLGGRIDLVLKGESPRFGLESTVLDCTGDHPVILRPGSVTLEDLRLVVPTTRFAREGLDSTAGSPGTRHPHYRGRAKLRIVDVATRRISTNRLAYIGLDPPTVPDAYALVHVADTVDRYARKLFSFIRQCEKEDMEELHCQRVGESGIGRALMDRLSRASVAD